VQELNARCFKENFSFSQNSIKYEFQLLTMEYSRDVIWQ